MADIDSMKHNSFKHRGAVECSAFGGADESPETGSSVAAAGRKNTNSRGPKKTPDYDNVFKTLKMKYKELFIPVINDIFNKKYPVNSKVEILPSEGYLAGNEMPHFSVIYVKSTNKTPKMTAAVFNFPDGQSVKYESSNIILNDLTKEYIMENRLFPYIPFYAARYEKDILSEYPIHHVEKDLKYFRDEMLRLYHNGELSYDEMLDLHELTNTIITHITNGNKNEERLVKIMGGVVLELASERLRNQGKAEGKAEGIAEGKAEGKAEMIIKYGRKDNLGDLEILRRIQGELDISLDKARVYLEQYCSQLE